MQTLGALLWSNNGAHNWTTSVTIGPVMISDCERVLGRDHPDTLASRNHLAIAYENVGRMGEAIKLYTRTLADSGRVLGRDHPDTLASRNNLAGAYDTVGRVGEAIELYTRTLADRERVLGPDQLDACRRTCQRAQSGTPNMHSVRRRRGATGATVTARWPPDRLAELGAIVTIGNRHPCPGVARYPDPPTSE